MIAEFKTLLINEHTIPFLTVTGVVELSEKVSGYELIDWLVNTFKQANKKHLGIDDDTDDDEFVYVVFEKSFDGTNWDLDYDVPDDRGDWWEGQRFIRNIVVIESEFAMPFLIKAALIS